MAKIVTSASEEKGARTISVEYDLGKTLADKAELFGEEVCNSNLESMFRIKAQAVIRRLLKQDKPDKEIAAAIAEWKPSLAKPGKSPLEKAKAAFDSLPPEEKAALLKALGKK